MSSEGAAPIPSTSWFSGTSAAPLDIATSENHPTSASVSREIWELNLSPWPRGDLGQQIDIAQIPSEGRPGGAAFAQRWRSQRVGVMTLWLGRPFQPHDLPKYL